MAAKVTVTQPRIYEHIGSELDSTWDQPSGNGTLTLFKAINANMADAGSAVIDIGGTDYAIPLLLNS